MLIALVVISWGFHIPVMKLGVEEVAPVSLNTARFALTALLFLPFAGRISWAEIRALLPVTLLFVCGNLIFAYLALDRITGNSFVVIIQINQPVTIIAAWLLFRERFGIPTLLGITLAFSGLMIVFGAPDIVASPQGALLAVLAATSWALGSLAMKRTAHIRPAAFLGYSYLMATPVALVTTLLLETGQVDRFMNADPAIMAFVLFYQVVLMGFMTFIWSGLMARNEAQYVTPFLMLQPFIAMLGGYYLLGETLNWNVAAGCLTVLAGIAVIHWRRILRRRSYGSGAI